MEVDMMDDESVLQKQMEGMMGRRLLDLVFIQDATGSMGSYISSATKNIEEICAAILQSDKLSDPSDLRVAVISYRDHPPQDHSFVTRVFPFTSSIPDVQAHLGTLYASGGGDGPEASTSAMYQALHGVEWREDAAKMVVLVTDAPPHGIGEYGDGFANGDPDGRDPILIAREMAEKGITLFVVACEPGLSGYINAPDFYKALCLITSGVMLPLTTASLLAHAIVGSALEHLDMERLIREVGQQVGERLRSGAESVDDIARELHEKLMLRNESTKKLVVENIYKDSEEANNNVQVWSTTPTLLEARPHLKKVQGSRFTDAYLQSRYSSSSYRSAADTRPIIPARPKVADPVSPRSTPSPTKPSSPPSRTVIKEFKAFGAAPTSSIGTFGGASSVGAPSSAFGMRGTPTSRGMGDDDDDEEDDGQKIGLEMGAITLDQTKRLAVAAAWRSRG